MYRRPAFDCTDDVLGDLIEQAAFGHVVSHGPAGFAATGLPLLLDRNDGSRAMLRGHMARANDHWRTIDGAPVLVVFQLTGGYVSPSWYASKVEHGRVVPTWDYEVVHVHGSARVHDDAGWVRRLVDDLTDRHESAHAERRAVPPWAVTDAPAPYVDGMLQRIVGIEISLERLEGARKLSQDRPLADRRGVVAGLASSPDPADRLLAGRVDTTLEHTADEASGPDHR